MAVRMSTGFAVQILGPQSFDSIFRYGCIEVRSGVQPDNADSPATGLLLARITRGGGAWEAGASTNGLEYERTGRYALKRAGHEWRMQGAGSGEAGWFRMIGNAPDDGMASLHLPRVDGAVGLEGTEADIQMFLPSLSITPTTSMSINHWWFALPPLGA